MGKLDKALSKARKAAVRVIAISSPIIILTVIILVFGFLPYLLNLVVDSRLYLYFFLAWVGFTVLHMVATYMNLFVGTYIAIKPLIGAKNAWGYLLWATKILSITTFLVNIAYFLTTLYLVGVIPYIFLAFLGVSWMVGVAVSFFVPAPIGRLSIVWAVESGLVALGTFLDMWILGTSFTLLFPGLFAVLSLGFYTNMDTILEGLGVIRDYL